MLGKNARERGKALRIRITAPLHFFVLLISKLLWFLLLFSVLWCVSFGKNYLQLMVFASWSPSVSGLVFDSVLVW